GQAEPAGDAAVEQLRVEDVAAMGCVGVVAGAVAPVIGRPGSGSVHRRHEPVFPGLRIPAGSNAALIRRSSAIWSVPSRSVRYGNFAAPTPCSPVIVPSMPTAALKTSPKASCAR